jgi:hypothetical protein
VLDGVGQDEKDYLTLEVSRGSITAFTGLKGCESAKVSQSGELSCARENLYLKVMDTHADNAFGVIEDRALKKQFAFHAVLSRTAGKN